jgi:hypothetical protein
MSAAILTAKMETPFTRGLAAHEDRGKNLGRGAFVSKVSFATIDID